MLELKNITKDYVSGDSTVQALKGISIEFRKSEFVSILGQSGCGKTTLLNIVGGLDRYTSGDLVINGKSTKKFKDKDWDVYRNYSVGFVFQNYNLIPHQTVLSNVELALTISGVSREERKGRAIKALEDVGLKEQIHKKPNQLSGGQMQRVAIARALVNNPDINVFTGLAFPNEDSKTFDYSQLSDEQRAQLAMLSAEQLAEVMETYSNNANASYDGNLELLGAVDLNKPSSISIYPKDFDAKDVITQEIDSYNQKQRDEGKEENVINYTDMIGIMMKSVSQIIDTISYVLIAFVAISLVVSSIMIGIITYISVLERTKEIGILRAIGASKKDISRVFNAETFIVGLIAGLLGIGVTILLNIPITKIIYAVTGVSVTVSLPVVGGIILVLISMILTIIAGLIPARMASKRDPVEALRTE